MIILDPQVKQAALDRAKQRNDEAIAQGRKHRNDIAAVYGNSYEAGLRLHETGALGEALFATWLGFPDWQLTVNEYRRGKPDVLGYEVRSRAYKHGEWCELSVYTEAKDEAIYVLVVRYSRDSGLPVGWMYGRDAKQYPLTDAYGAGHYAHHVPELELHPMHTLPITDAYADAVRNSTLVA